MADFMKSLLVTVLLTISLPWSGENVCLYELCMIRVSKSVSKSTSKAAMTSRLITRHEP